MTSLYLNIAKHGSSPSPRTSSVLLDVVNFFLFSEKGIVYVDDIESDDEDKDLDSLDNICRGHGISIYNDPQNIRFEIFSTRIDEQSKRVVRLLFFNFIFG